MRTVSLGILAVFAGLVACGPRAGNAPPSDDPVVATVARVPIHASEVALQLRRQGGSDVRRALEDCIAFSLLARAATEGPFGPDGDDLAALRRATVERLVERELEPLLAQDAIPDAEVRALYEKGKRRFVHGRLVQAQVMAFFTGARMKPEPRARAEHDAGRLKAFLDQHRPVTPGAVEALAKDPAWIDRKLTVQEVWQEDHRAEPYPKVVGQALAQLHGPGELTPVVGDETGYYLAMYLAEKPAEARSYQQVAPELRNEMFEPWRRQRFLRLVADMASGYDIAIVPDNLALLEQESGAAAR